MPVTTGTRGQRRTNNNPRNLDYAWGCRDGVWKCMNTHGLPGDQSNQWTVVNNEANCIGTDKTGECGATGPQFLPGNRTTNSVYDYVIKQAVNGQVKYYGVLVDGIEENLSPITNKMYQALTGQPDVYSGEGVFRLKRKQLFGDDLIRYNNRIANKLGMNHNQVNKIVSYLQKTRGMVGLTQELSKLLAKGVPVADLNNMFEVMFKYLKFNEGTVNVIPNNVFHDITGLITQGRGNAMTERSGGLNLPQIASDAMDFLIGLFEGPTKDQDAKNMNLWQNDYAVYMQTDFGEIERVKSEQGPRAALDLFLQYKKTSWLEMKNFIQTWCNAKGYPLPPFYTDWWAFQNTYETELRAEVNGSSSPGNGSPGPGGEFGPDANKPGGSTTPTSGIDFTTIGLIAAAFLLIMLIAK